MAQVMNDVQPESLRNHRAGDTGLIDLADWMKAEEEAEAKAEAARLAEESTKKQQKKSINRIEATTIVTGRPSTNNILGTNDLLSSYNEPIAPIKVDLGGKNWVGQLFEYRQAHLAQSGPDYQESSSGLNLFTCLVTIGERPDALAFGDLRTTFSRKKDAKQYAAKLAVEWLIAAKHMPADGSVSFPKPRPQYSPTPKTAPPVTPQKQPSAGNAPLLGMDDGDAATVPSGSTTPSYGQRVATLCARLAIAPPTYHITPHTDFAAMYSGHAVFENGMSNSVIMVEGPVGEFRNVFGKKKAREACAEKVLVFLEAIARDRASGRRGAGGAGSRTGRKGEGTEGEGEGEVVGSVVGSLLDL